MWRHGWKLRARRSSRVGNVERLESRNLLASMPQLLYDINQTTADSQPAEYTTVGNGLFFVAESKTYDRELWRTNGTTGETYRVKDIVPGPESSDPRELVAGDGVLFFAAYTDVFGGELWRSDGTEDGTVQVVNINANGGSHPRDLVYGGGRVYFTAQSEFGERDLYASDGTAEGTVRLYENPTPWSWGAISELTVVGESLYFTAPDPVFGQQLWKSDGTPEGTSIVRAVSAGGPRNPSLLTQVGDKLYFRTYEGGSQRLWSSDGTPQGTAPVAGAPALFDVRDFTDVSGQLFFVASDWTAGVEVWTHDESGVHRVRDINPGEPASYPRSLVSFNGLLHFAATNPDTGFELWRSDGTELGTYMVVDLAPGLGAEGFARGSDPQPLVVADDRLYFFTNEQGATQQLWISDGTAEGTVSLREFPEDERYFYPSEVETLGRSLYFVHRDRAHGVEPWASDGTASGTRLSYDVNSVTHSSYPHELTPLGDEVLFVADDGVHGHELWATDGSAAGTRLVREIDDSAYIYSPGDLIAFDDRIFFSAGNLATGRELWASDGTEAGTVLVKELAPGSDGGQPRGFSVVGDRLFMLAEMTGSGMEVWTSDGTEAGTTRVRSLAGELRGASSEVAVLGDRYYFWGENVDSRRELWSSDGTLEGTVPIWTAPAGHGDLGNLTVVGELLLFTFNGDLWRTDGTEAGTFLVESRIFNNSLDWAAWRKPLPVLGGRVVFSRYEFALERTELRSADGVLPGSSLIASFGSQSDINFQSVAGVVGDGLIFVVSGPSLGYEVWKTDGTPEGTSRVHGTQLAFHDTIQVLDVTVGNGQLGIAFDGEAGPGAFCLWAGPEVGGLNAPPPSEICSTFAPLSVQNIGGTLYYTYSDGEHGIELWVQSPTPTGDFSGDGVIDDADIDLLHAAIRGGAHEQEFDLTGDGLVDRADATRLVVDILHTTFGDANLDRVVDRRDLVSIVRNLGRSDQPGWRSGDFDGDGRVGLVDIAHAQSSFVLSPPEPPAAIVAAVSASTTRKAARATTRATRRVDPDLQQTSIVQEDSTTDTLGVSRQSRRASAGH